MNERADPPLNCLEWVMRPAVMGISQSEERNSAIRKSDDPSRDKLVQVWSSAGAGHGLF